MEFLAELHPKVVHFPIALLMISVLFDVVGILSKKEYFHKSAHLLLLLGVLGSFAAAFTGNQAFSSYKFWNNSSGELMSNHELYANITIWYFTLILFLRTFLVLRKKYFTPVKYIIIVLGIVGCYFLFQTSEYGGKLVNKYGIGTDLIPDQTIKNE
ncbi:MAG: hypothetical protein PVF17_03180 [Ignavibacteria bacterium]|jgi:uncharacterized membrane protein